MKLELELCLIFFVGMVTPVLADNAGETIITSKTDSLAPIIRNLVNLNPPIIFDGLPKYLPDEQNQLNTVENAIEIERTNYLGGKISRPMYIQDLEDSYHFFAKYDTYGSVCLKDLISRLLMEVSVKMLVEGRIDQVQTISNEISLNAIPDCLLKTPNATFRTLPLDSQCVALCLNWGITLKQEEAPLLVLVFSNRVKHLDTKSLLSEDNRIGLAFRILDTERLRRNEMNGAIEFLSGKGDVSRLQGERNTYFNSVIPLSRQKTYAFAPMGLDGLRYIDVLDFYGIGWMPHQQKGFTWMRGILELQ